MRDIREKRNSVVFYWTRQEPVRVTSSKRRGEEKEARLYVLVVGLESSYLGKQKRRRNVQTALKRIKKNQSKGTTDTMTTAFWREWRRHFQEKTEKKRLGEDRKCQG